MKTKEFAALVLKSQNCFIIITRESLPGIPYSYREIYRIKTFGKFHTLERMYEECNQFEEQDFIITEDEDAGLEYYQYFYGDKVSSSHGNSNLVKYGNEKAVLIGDGCAIGAFMQDLILTKAKLYLPESFEWKLLQNKMFFCDKQIEMLVKYPEKIGTEYPSMERYCTKLLTEITRNTPAQYTKSRLNSCYKEPCCCKGTKCQFFTREKELG